MLGSGLSEWTSHLCTAFLSPGSWEPARPASLCLPLTSGAFGTRDISSPLKTLMDPCHLLQPDSSHADCRAAAPKHAPEQRCHGDVALALVQHEAARILPLTSRWDRVCPARTHLSPPRGAPSQWAAPWPCTQPCVTHRPWHTVSCWTHGTSCHLGTRRAHGSSCHSHGVLPDPRDLPGSTPARCGC